ncbi:hypothetical protein ACO0QE_003897 [Hanseniaspora vineae]
MAITISPLTKIIFLSGLLALGFLLVILSCALYSNYYPLFDLLLFLLSSVPRAMFPAGRGGAGSAGYSSFLDDSQGAGGALKDTGTYFTSWFLTLAIGLPVVMEHSNVINKRAMILSITGGGIIYGTIVLFGWFFSNGGSWLDEQDDDEYDGFGY